MQKGLNVVQVFASSSTDHYWLTWFSFSFSSWFILLSLFYFFRTGHHLGLSFVLQYLQAPGSERAHVSEPSNQICLALYVLQDRIDGVFSWCWTNDSFMKIFHAKSMNVVNEYLDMFDVVSVAIIIFWNGSINAWRGLSTATILCAVCCS